MPTIAAINGPAIGAGLCLSLAADLRIASSEAKMALNFVRIGLTPGMGGSFLLPRLVGHQIASRILLTGEVFTPQDAKDWGLILKHVPERDLMNESLGIARYDVK